MKTEFQAKFLQSLLKKRDSEGFTLIELLVVIIIIGILSAIALPSFLNQANKARQSEARTYVGSLNRAQQAYRLENPTFSGSISELGIGVKESTTYYTYSVSPTTANDYATIALGTAKDEALKGYIGAVQLTQKTTGAGTNAINQDATTVAVLCEAKSPGKTARTAGDISGYTTTTVANTDIACNTANVKSIQ